MPKYFRIFLLPCFIIRVKYCIKYWSLITYFWNTLYKGVSTRNKRRERERERKRGNIGGLESERRHGRVAQMCLKHATTTRPTPNLYSHPPTPTAHTVIPYFTHTGAQFLNRANLIAPRHRWPLSEIELSTISLPVQDAISVNPTPWWKLQLLDV